MAILLNFEGKIVGASEISKHEEWIPCESTSSSVSRGVGTGGAVNDRNTATAQFQDVALSRLSDLSSNELAYQAMSGKTICKIAYINVVNVDGQGGVKIAHQTALKDPMIASYAVQRAGDETPYENLSLVFTAFATKWNVFEEGGTEKEGKWQGWDIATQKDWKPE